MNLYDVHLDDVRLSDIRASTPSVAEDAGGDEELTGYNAHLHVEILNPGEGLAVNDTFQVKIAMQTIQSQKAFLQLTMIGTFRILGEAAITDLSHESAPYELGSLLYPYIRNLTKPIMEYLGASDVEMPFAPPTPPEKKKKPVKRKRIQSD